MEDVVLGRAIVFRAENAGRIDGLGISPVGVMEETTKIRAIHNLIFECLIWGTREERWRSVNVISTGRGFPRAS